MLKRHLLPVYSAYIIAFTPAASLASEEDHLRMRCARLDANNQCALYSPSLAELFTHPNRYQGKRVRVWGYVRLEFETTAVYFSRDAYDARVTQESLWIRLPSRDAAAGKSKSGPAYVEGVFDSRERGHFSLYAGGLVDVKTLTIH